MWGAYNGRLYFTFRGASAEITDMAVSEDNRWAGDLSASIARVTAANLGRAMKTGNVRTYPWQRDEEIDQWRGHQGGTPCRDAMVGDAADDRSFER